MRIDKLYVKNFRGFTEREFSLHPQFNLVVGENGLGKTSVLEALAVAIGSWFLGMGGVDTRHIRPEDIRYEARLESPTGKRKRWRVYRQYPVVVRAEGVIEECYHGKLKTKRKENSLIWERTINREGGRTTYAGALEIKNLSADFQNRILGGQKLVLPLIRYFGAGRLWDFPRDLEDKSIARKKGQQPGDYADTKDIEDDDFSSPFYGYRLSVDKRCNPSDLMRWMLEERRAEVDEDEENPALRLMYKAIDKFLPEVKYARYSLAQKTLMLTMRTGPTVGFQNLSDGYRNVVAIVADLAIKAIMLNPHLGNSALEETPGVVLIDELDLHLHPKWQRRIIEDLRRTFPKIQFICTTHSPFLIQSLRSGSELIMLEGYPTNELGNKGIEEITQGLMGVDRPDVSLRYQSMKQAARSYLELLEEAALTPEEKLANFKERLASSIGPYADNPAFQAFLEMQRVLKLGE